MVVTRVPWLGHVAPVESIEGDMQRRIIGIVMAAMLGATAAAAQSAGNSAVGSVRARDDLAQFLLDQGRLRSATFASLVTDLDQSDVVVYVDVDGSGADLGPSGRLQFVTARGGVRYLHAFVDTGTTTWSAITTRQLELIAVLAHELQHATEVMSAPSVMDADGFEDLYQTVGIRKARWQYETDAAQEVAKRVLAELRRQNRGT